MPIRVSFLRRLLPLLLLLLIATPVRADDWPQWLGPRRDGVWREANVATAFPPSGPAVRWRVPVGAGYAGPAVAKGRVFVTDHVLKPGTGRPKNPFARDMLAGVERVQCFAEADGKLLWTDEYDCPYSISYSSGPRATPTVDGDRVYTLGAEGDLRCLNVESGKVVWSKHLSGPDAPTPIWGFAAHPLVDGEKLICLTTSPAANATAFNKMTGEVIWASVPAREPGYCAPMIFDAAGVRQLILWNPRTVNGLNPETGKVYWTVPFGPIENGVSIATPRFLHDAKLGDLLFISGPREGGLLLKLDKDSQGGPNATVLWQGFGTSGKKSDGVGVLMAPPMFRDANLYAIGFRGDLRCLDVPTGRALWSTFVPTLPAAGNAADTHGSTWATAFLLPIGDAGPRFLLANELGDLIFADLSPAGYKEISRAHVLDPTNTDAGRPVLWCVPACANKTVFWRNDKEMIAVDVGLQVSR